MPVLRSQITDYRTNKQTNKQMLAHLRTATHQQESRDVIHGKNIAIVMRDNVRNERPPLTNVNYHDTEVAHALGEIYAREFASLIQNLNQANAIAAKYHEAAFDNTDAYIDVGHSQQTNSNEMTAEQRHASKLLSRVGTNYSEIHMAIRMLGCDNIQAPRDIITCGNTVIEELAHHFHATAATNPSIIEDAFDRLRHIVKHVWDLVNTLALSNLFRFADSIRPIIIATSDDAIFIPHIPTRQLS